MCAPPGRTLSQTKYGHKQDAWPETTRKANATTINPETVSHVAEQFWILLPCCSPPGHPFLIKSFALSVRVSPRTIHFLMLDKSPLLGPGRGLPSGNKTNSTFHPAHSKDHILLIHSNSEKIFMKTVLTLILSNVLIFSFFLSF